MLNSDLGNVKLIPEGSGANVKYYAQLGADAASKKLLGGKTVVLLGIYDGSHEHSGLSIDVTKTISNYQSLTVDNFIVEPTLLVGGADNNAIDRGLRVVKSYNNGIFYTKVGGKAGSAYAYANQVKVYCFY
ncbi:MAG: hypothetical protein ACLR0F_14015 [Eisenbergiella sp.]